MPEKIVALSRQVSDVVASKISAINTITGATKILALNALIEAARAGEAGRGFGVVAQEVKNVSQRITEIAGELNTELSGSINQLTALGEHLIETIRGGRLIDLALNMIDIMDRNLYERSCDVRWWATDSAMVDALANPNEQTIGFAGKRLAVILDSYTVYIDLWLADANGRVIANGRPGTFREVVGTSVAHESWFKDAMATRDGGEFAVADIYANPQLNKSLVATYSTAVREHGEANGRVLGVLGIHFDWAPQSGGVISSVRLDKEEQEKTRCLLVDSRFRVLAASDKNGVLTETIELNTSGKPRGSYNDGRGNVVGFALTPGFETYQGLGWYGVIIQELPKI